MTPTLTEEQSRAVAAHPNEPVVVTDPATNRAYVLLSADLYERVRESLEGLRPADIYPAVERTFSPGWNDPAMDDYDRYEELRK
jgi:hypothetical protein